MARQSTSPAADVAGQVQTVFTPINVILISLALVIIYLRTRPAKPQAFIKRPAPIVFKTFTPQTLLPYNGQNNMPVYLSIRGRVFDVSTGRNFYGPGGPYQNFAGRDASRGLAFGSFDEDMLTKDLDGPLDDLQDLDQDQISSLNDWQDRFQEKYVVVGKLVAAGSEEAKNEQ